MSKIIELNRVILVLELNFRSLEGEYEAVIGNWLIMKYDLDLWSWFYPAKLLLLFWLVELIRHHTTQ